MPLTLDDEQQMLRDTARAFVADAAPVAQLRALRDERQEKGFSRSVWRQFADMGFTGILVPEAHGGLGLGHVEAGIVLEEIGRNLSASPFLTTAVGAVAALIGSSAAERWFPGILSGDVVAALALDEGARHTTRVEMRAERAGNGFRLSGTKRLVVMAHAADLLLVTARTAGSPDDVDGVTLFAVDANGAGVRIAPERLVDGSIAATVRLDGAAVDADAIVGEIDHAPVARVRHACTAGLSAELLGIGDGAAAMTLSYLRERRQFGVPIGSFQALQHRAAHLYAELEVARAAVLKAQQLLDADDDRAEIAVSVAKAQATTAATLAVQEGVQMHGGVGMTDAFDIGFFMKRARVAAEWFGDANFHADRVARLSGY